MLHGPVSMLKQEPEMGIRGNPVHSRSRFGPHLLAEARPVHGIGHPREHIWSEVAESLSEISQLAVSLGRQLRSGVVLPQPCEISHGMTFWVSLQFPCWSHRQVLRSVILGNLSSLASLGKRIEHGAESAGATCISSPSLKVVSTLIPSPGISVIGLDCLSSMEPHTRLRGHQRRSPPSEKSDRGDEMLVGVLARLRSHLREMTGLSIRATVSQLDCTTTSPLAVSRSRTLYILPGVRRPVPPTRPQPLHNRPPSPTGFPSLSGALPPHRLSTFRAHDAPTPRIVVPILLPSE